MESIVLHSDIARLVLSYLLNSDLKRAALTFSRTSTHLNQEYVALCQGLQPHNFLNGGLEDIIREHVKITSMVANAVQKLPAERRQRLQELNLSDRVSALLKLDNSTSVPNSNSNMQRKRRRNPVNKLLLDEDPNSSSDPISSKRACPLAPHLFCSVKRTSFDVSEQVEDTESLNSTTSSTSTDITSSNTDDPLTFGRKGPKNNSTPRMATSDEPATMVPTPQTMPEITHAIMTNDAFQEKLLSNINVALQSLTVHAPTADSVDSEAVLNTLVKNILEATEEDPSFDRIIQEVVGKEVPPKALEQTMLEVQTEQLEPAPPQTPLIIRSAIATATDGVNADGGNVNAVINLNANSSIGNLIDPNFSISKLIVLNSNESAQKQHLLPSANLSFDSENLLNFAGECGAPSEVSDNTANSGAGQVCVDATNGQLTFPLFLSNEAMLSHLPFLVNNEWLAQHLRADVFANTDVSHIEIPLPEPITVTADQLPPNSIIINSAVKQALKTVDAPSVEPPVQLIAEDQQLPTKPLTTVTSASTANVLPDHSGGKVPASLDSSRIVVERVTPSTSGIVNVKAFRSLSTPRKRTSHVRTLNFSPKVAAASMQSTPLSTRRMQQQLSQRRMQLNALKEEEQNVREQEKNSDAHLEHSNPGTVATSAACIATVTAAAAAAVSTDGSGNESNSCVPPLFAMEESSNQTVITKQSSKQATQSNQSLSMLATPKPKQSSKQTKQSKQSPSLLAKSKLKQKRRAAVTACKRINSIAATMGENSPESANKQLAQSNGDAFKSSSLDDSKENQRMPMSEQLELPDEPQSEDMMAAWQRQMHGSSNDLEQRLRAINAKREQMLKNNSPVRRNRSVADKKSKTLTPLAPKQKKLKSPKFRTKKEKTAKQMSAKQEQQQILQLCSNESEFNIKLTPSKKKKPKLGKELKKDIKETKKLENQPKKSKASKDSQQKVEQQQQQQQLKAALSKPEIIEPTLERMEMMQETPRKLTPLEELDDMPPTPGPTLMPPPETPYSQLLLPSASFLFGSDTKSILDTPMLMAITPGVHLTPFAQSISTPHSSGARTDYSSGSSYYRPDEAEHMDTNAQCALQPTPPKEANAVVEQTSKLPSPATCIELHAERVPVEPTVLRRVRSFGSVAVDSAEGAVALAANVEQPLVETPHYKLVSGLPELAQDSESNSSSSSSGSTTTSSSCSSSSNDTNSSNSSVSPSAHTRQVAGDILPAVSTIKLLDIENLSDISSTEDEEWLKAAANGGSLDAPPLTIESEPTQLVSQDGEVRYPLRNWLTPNKDVAASANVSGGTQSSSEMAPPSAAVTSATKITTEERMQNLANIRERVKAKCKQESEVSPKKRAKPMKKFRAMRGKALPSNPQPHPLKQSMKSTKEGLKTPQKPSIALQSKNSQTLVNIVPTAEAAAVNESVKSKSVLGKSSKALIEQPSSSSNELDPALLIALNLSAKKQQPTARVAVVIAAQPVPSTTTGKRRGRPKKAEKTDSAPEPARSCTRRSTRLFENKTPAAEEPQPSGIEASKSSNTSTTAKITKKPAKKRAEARLESVAPTVTTMTEARPEPVAPIVTTLAEAHTTQQSPEQEQQQSKPSSSTPAPASALSTSSESELDMSSSIKCAAAPSTNSDSEMEMSPSAFQLGSTISYTYANSGSRPPNPIPRQTPDYFTNYQMRIVVDNEAHSVRITSPQLLRQSLPSAEDNANETSKIRNIPKKRIKQFSNADQSMEQAAKRAKPAASSTPLATKSSDKKCDKNDQEVAPTNTSSKSNASEEQDDDALHIEDIESILSRLHGK